MHALSIHTPLENLKIHKWVSVSVHYQRSSKLLEELLLTRSYWKRFDMFVLESDVQP